MKKILLLILFSFLLIACNRAPSVKERTDINSSAQFIDSTDMTNNFYDNTETHNLALQDLFVDGEVENPGKVDFSDLPVRSIVVKETLLDTAGGDKFSGAFRYDGYSLFDILEKRIIRKTNASEFNSIIDLYVEVVNKAGEKVVFSWGELYYPNNLHRILIARSVARIVPSKTKDLWVLPENSRIVAGNDLVTERNISDPVKITVKSYRRSFPVNRGVSPLYSGKFRIYSGNDLKGEISKVPEPVKEVTFNTIFYGRGKGIHSTSPFTGTMLKDVLQSYYPGNRKNLMTGIVCIVGADGYRCTLTYSELFNRNDQQEFLLVKTKEREDGGLFRMFAASDFFSDRAIKSISEIRLDY